MDAFYASIEQRDRPELRGKPVIVGGTPEGRGVVSAASYEARRFGVHSAMPASQAVRLCPQGVFLPVDITKYLRVSQQVMSILEQYTPLVEKVSIDEAFLDLTGTERLHRMTAPQLALEIKRHIREEVKLTASVGLAPNKFLAKLASDLQKPDGFVVVPHHEVSRFLAPLPVESLPGVGKALGRKLRGMGVTTVGMLAEMSEETLNALLGVIGRNLGRIARGIDPRPVIPTAEAKSISSEQTFPTDINNWEILETTLLHLCEEVAFRLRCEEVRGRTVIVKLRFADFATITRSRTLIEPTCVTSTLFHTARQLLAEGNPRKRRMRLLGVAVTNLVKRSEAQLHLFDDTEERLERVEAAIDMVRKKFGDRAIQRGRLLE